MTTLAAQRAPSVVFISGGLLYAALVGAAMGTSVPTAVVLVLFPLAGYAIAFHPVRVLQLLLVSNAIRWSDVPTPGFTQIYIAQKLFFFIVLMRCLVTSQRRPLAAPVLAVLVLAALWTYPLSTPLPGVDPSQTVQSLATLVLPWLAASMTLQKSDRRKLLAAVCWLPLISIVAGIALEPLTGLSVYKPDFTGAYRLAGASIPAFFAFLGVNGAVAAKLLAEESRKYWLLVLVNTVCVFLSGTRGASICVTVALAPAVARWVFERTRASVDRMLNGIGVLAGLCIVAAIAVPILTQRTEVGGTFNSSGRGAAWRFFLGLADANPFFGRGIGAGPVASQNASGLSASFVAQHSEYVRLVLETGYVGLTLFMLAVAVTSTRLALSQPKNRRVDVAMYVIAVLIYSGTDNTLTDFQFAVAFGLILSWWWSEHAEPDARPQIADAVRTRQRPALVSHA